MKRRIHASTVSLTALATALGAASAAAAQGPGNATTPHSVDELVVTAQKREQNLQDVPIVVTTVNAQQLKDAGVRDIKDLTILAPGLTVTSTSTSAITTARIRGIGTVGDNPGLESSVGVVIDGVSRPRNGVAFQDLGELDRIEVLKGPQGTLFGKNTSAGVINILTKRPSFTLGAESEATVSNYNGFGATGSITGPIVSDKLAGRLFVAARARDGFYERPFGQDGNNQHMYTIRGQLLYRPTADLDINFAADYTRQDERCCSAVQIHNGPTSAVVLALAPGGLANPPDPSAFVDYSTHNDLKKTRDKGVQATVDWLTPWLGGATLTSITAYRDWKQAGGGDTDWTAADIVYAPGFDETDNVGSTRFRQFSQELRLAGATEKLNWLVGGFYSDEKLDLFTRTTNFGTQYEQYLAGLLTPAGFTALTGRLPTGGLFVAGNGPLDTYNQHEQGEAIFTNESYRFTDKLELTVGARYTWEKKDLDSFWSNTDGGVGCLTALARAKAIGGPLPAAGTLVQAGGLLGVTPYGLMCQSFWNPAFAAVGHNSQSLKESKLTGTVKLSYRFSPEVMAYASYARGYKAGGFNLDRVVAGAGLQTIPGVPVAPNLDTHFAPETVDSYELGVKNTLLNRTLLLNATIFYQDYKDFQLNQFTGLIFIVNSVPKVVSRGVDADFVWFTPVEGLSLQGGVTYAETYYPRDTPASIGRFLPGSRISLAPLWSTSMSVNYEHPVTADLVGHGTVNVKYVSSYNTGSNLDPLKTQGAFAVVNARLGVGPQDKRWEAEIWAQNLFDETYYQVAFDAPFQGAGAVDAFLGAPRTFGATVRFSY